MDYARALELTDRATSWQIRYPQLAEEVRTVLRSASAPLGTTALAKRLCADLTPAEYATVYKAIFDGLKALADHDLADWTYRGDKMKRQLNGKMALPRLWKAPPEDTVKPYVATSPGAPLSLAHQARAIASNAEMLSASLAAWKMRHASDLTDADFAHLAAVEGLIRPDITDLTGE